MKTLLRILFAFLALTGAALLASTGFGVELGHQDYWDKHGFFFLVFVTLFPRLTLLVADVATGGPFWWLSWLFAPRLLVAALATFAYWNQNPLLVAIAWVVAFGGESSEKFALVKRGSFQFRQAGSPGPARGPSPDEQLRGRAGDGYESAKWVDAEIKK